MDIGTIHSIWTIVLFISFFGVVWWAFGKSRKERFEQDAKMIFDDEVPSPSHKQGVTKQ
ncbi:cytochrome c oxidase cbb3-type subunit 4 [Vibrio xiamenensis]|uniref:Cytochrome c oxidase cbb3-type subunit 4 n=1 Tax=Vibrio xiamenensis TaxID=861298 RepID=A0A1G7YDE0_9VIBR|nr:CcoQ/FixQ family Cbb3-type cytochrome c oxidase assembly chaperone [Vibrio xiamenensis]SDG94404.1 cytochrome c oxidase cbb3-type subunit 4 [Vibrio xiamenensis]